MVMDDDEEIEVVSVSGGEEEAHSDSSQHEEGFEVSEYDLMLEDTEAREANMVVKVVMVKVMNVVEEEEIENFGYGCLKMT